jgi:hypothetical protein
MSWRFRKSFSPLPGIRLTLSRSGLSTSIGFGPLRVTSGPRGNSLTTRLPGSAVSYQQSIRSAYAESKPDIPQGDDGFDKKDSSDFLDQEAIESAGHEELTTSGLAEFKRLLQQSDKELKEIKYELSVWRPREIRLVTKHKNWEKGWLFKRMFPERFQSLRVEAEESTARRAELEEQEKLAEVRAILDIPAGVTKAFGSMRERFSKLAAAQKIWDTISSREINQVLERTTAQHMLDRKPVRFSLSKCGLFESGSEVPRMQNANGGDIYFYPAFVLYFVDANSFALLEYKEIKLTYDPMHCIEREGIPSDSSTVGHTWAKTNKNGSPDKRFKDNYQIPIAEYALIRIKSASGLNEQYLVSNNQAAKAFANSWDALSEAIASAE